MIATRIHWSRTGPRWHAGRNSFPGDPTSYCGRDLSRMLWSTFATVEQLDQSGEPVCKHCRAGVLKEAR